VHGQSSENGREHDSIHSFIRKTRSKSDIIAEIDFFWPAVMSGFRGLTARRRRVNVTERPDGGEDHGGR